MFIKKESLESVYSSNSRLNLLNKRKRLTPLGAGDMSAGGRGAVAQRVLSAKAHRVKQLQNQLADAHYHLQELSNENKVLRALQKKQEVALQRYESSSAELPTVLNSHSEEIRVQQAKFKQLKKQYQEVQQKLKERDMQLLQLKDEHNHLLELSRDRNLLEREKLSQQVHELTAKVLQQNETISTLQRRIALEQKNFRHQLQNEINKHKDTRHDLDLAISNADKLSTIIEMKEKMLSTAAGRNLRSPPKGRLENPTSTASKPVSKSKSGNDIRDGDRNERLDRIDRYERNERFDRNERYDRGDRSDRFDRSDRGDRTDRSNMDALTKLCESSRNLNSVLSNEDDTTSSSDYRPRYNRSRTNSLSNRTTPTRKASKNSDEIIELAKTVQDGMADLAIFDDIEKPSSPDEMQKKIEIMKKDLMKKIKTENEEDKDKEKSQEKTVSRKPSLTRRQSTEESIEEKIEIEADNVSPIERPKSRGRRNSSVSFDINTTIEETTTTVTINDYRGDEIERIKPRRANSGVEKKPPQKQLDKYCKDIMLDIEKSSKVIDKHMKQFNHTKLESDKLVEQLAAVDKINNFVNSAGEIPEATLHELNNNFKMLTDSVLTEAPVTRKRALVGRRNSKPDNNTKHVLDDSALSNQDLLDDLLGRK